MWGELELLFFMSDSFGSGLEGCKRVTPVVESSHGNQPLAEYNYCMEYCKSTEGLKAHWIRLGRFSPVSLPKVSQRHRS